MQAQQDSFQAAIDYLLRGRRQATQQRQGLFTQAQAPAPTTNISSVVKDVFGDRYMNQGGSYRPGVDPVTGEPLAVGNPFTSGAGLFSSRGMSPADYMDRAASVRDSANTVGGVAGIFNPIVGVLAKHGMNYYANYLDQQAQQAYQPFYDSGVYDYYSQENVDRDLAAAGYEPRGYNEEQLDINWDDYTTDYQRNDPSYDSGIGTSFDGGASYSNQDQADRDVGNMS